MKQITQIGATPKEAISLALQQLGKTLEQVDVEVLQEGRKGFLGFGARAAEVRVTVKEVVEVKEDSSVEKELIVEKVLADSELKREGNIEESIQNGQASQIQTDHEEQQDHDNPIEETKAYLFNIAKEMGISDLKIASQVEGKNIYFKLESEKAALLIGKRGQTLNSLQQLAQLVLNKSAKSFTMLTLDVENYRERRQEALELLANRMADKAIRQNHKVEFEAMPSYERKIIHNALANRIDIETYSEGTEPNRYLVIEPIK